MSSCKVGTNFLNVMSKVQTQISATEVKIDNRILYFNVDGKKYRKPLSEISNKLKTATTAELQLFRVSPSGYGIHWPLIDEDISFKGLIN